MEYLEFDAMNTVVQIAAEGDPTEIEHGFNFIRRFVEISEQRFSRFRESSELSRLNRASGSWFFASRELFEVVNEALAMHNLTDGLFDPSILSALRRAGYDRSMDEIREFSEVPIPDGEMQNSPPFEDIELDPDINAIYFPSGMQIDLGGIAKGWISARAAEIMLQFSDSCAVSAGGDMALNGFPAGERTWAISLEDPLDPDRVLAVIRIQPGGLATSAVTRRKWVQGGEKRHHIIDPRTRKPSLSPWLSVTVYAKSAIVAEVFAKALLIAGPTDIVELAGRVEDLQYLVVEADGNLVGTIENMEIIHDPDPIL
jgi:FAD:protein FMN transferase